MSRILHRSETDRGRVFPTGVGIERSSNGLGVFSFAFIPRETAIGRVRGEIITDPDYTSNYCVDADDGRSLEPIPPFCYLNHSCEPNCVLMQYVKESEQDGSEVTGALYETDEYMEEEECFFGDGGADETDGPYESDYDANEEFDNDTEDELDSDSLLLDETKSDEAYGVEIWVESLRDILPGEELTIDYAWPASRAMRCSCGSPMCRGWIVDPEEIDEIPESIKFENNV